MHHARRLLEGLIVCCLVFAGARLVRGQDPGNDPGSTDKLLLVRTLSRLGDDQLALRRDKSSGFWTSSLPRIKDWKLPEGEEAIEAVDLRTRLIGEKAQVVISVFKGPRFGERSEVIATLMLAEGESARIDELRRYGYAPIFVKMVGTTSGVANVPLVVNPAPLLTITVAPKIATLPSFEVKFVNNADKSINAIAWHTQAAGEKITSSFSQSNKGRPLIMPGQSYSLTIEAHNPDPLRNNVELVIEAVVYEGGAIEGDAARGQTFISFQAGRQTALSRIVPILQSAMAGRDESIDLADLIAQIDGISAPVGIPRPEQIAFSGVIADLLKELRSLSASSPHSDTEVRRAITLLTQSYREWSDRLSK